MSHPIQVYLDDDDHERLESWARERQWTKSQAVRAAIRALTRTADDTSDPLLSMSGMIADDDLPSDASERFDECLAQTFVAESSPRYGRSGSAKSKRLR